MAEQSDQVHPLAAHGTPRSDAESGDNNLQSKELRRKKRMKCYISMAIFAVVQVAFMLIFSLVILPVDTPRLRLSAVTVNNLNTGTQASPAFNMSIMAHVRVKNTNFGTFKYDPSTISFVYGDTILGQENIPKAKAKARSTKKVDLLVNLGSKNISNDSKLGSDIKSGFLKISSNSNVFGEVKMFLVVKKKREAVMNCNMIINLTTKEVQDLECK